MSLNVVSSFNGVTDPDAGAYIAAVEAADGQLLEFAVGKAINDFVVGCKADGIWDAIKASCILAGARTFAGALIPLKGTAPNKFGTDSNWNYNRKTGLQGDGSTNYLNSNRNNNADPQNSKHAATYLTSAPSQTGIHIGTTAAATPGSSQIASDLTNGSGNFSLSNTSVGTVTGQHLTLGFRGANRSTDAAITARVNAVNTSLSLTSNTPANSPTYVFCRDGNAVFSNARLAFYSIGESLDLAKLDARVTDLITAFGAAIP